MDLNQKEQWWWEGGCAITHEVAEAVFKVWNEFSNHKEQGGAQFLRTSLKECLWWEIFSLFFCNYVLVTIFSSNCYMAVPSAILNIPQSRWRKHPKLISVRKSPSDFFWSLSCHLFLIFEIKLLHNCPHTVECASFFNYTTTNFWWNIWWNAKNEDVMGVGT